MRSIICLLVASILIAFASAQVDQDGDGFFTSSQFNGLRDCCDNTDDCPNPYLVNPGAMEILGNGIDDNCDGVIDQVETCSSYNPLTQTAQFVFDTFAETAQIMGAIDIYSCSNGQDLNWGYQSLYQVALQLANGVPRGNSGPNEKQFAIMNNLGQVGPVKGKTFFVMSTGFARNANDPDIDATYGNTSFGSTVVPPPSQWAAIHPTIPNGCSKKKKDDEEDIQKRGLFYGYYYNNEAYTYQYVQPYSNLYTNVAPNANTYDSARVQFTLRQPTNFNAFAFKVKFSNSAKQMPPTDPCNGYNDYFLILKQTPTTAPNLPSDRNIATNQDGTDIMSLNSASTFYTNCLPSTNQPAYCKYGFRTLVGTANTGATDWTYVGTSASPGELFNMSFVIWDTQNSFVDSSASIDAFAPVGEAVLNPSNGNFLSGYTRTSDVQLIKAVPNQSSFSRSQNPSGISVTYTITIRNNGPEAITDLFVSYTPAKNTTHSSATGLTCSTLPINPAGYPFALRRCRATAYTINNPLAAGQVATVTITVNVENNFVGQVLNSFWVTCSSVNLDYTNDFAFAPVAITP